MYIYFFCQIIGPSVHCLMDSGLHVVQEGDTVLLLRRVDDQWLVGRVGDKEGIFPQNFVDIIHPLHDEVALLRERRRWGLSHT